MWKLIWSFSEQGLRDTNQDAFMYRYDNEKDILVALVCDGVGGYDCGEIASKIVTQKFVHTFFEKNEIQNVSIDIKDVMDDVIKELNEYANKYPGCNSMATTLVGVVAYGLNIHVFHCGDSRMYHIRNNEILFKTMDHTNLYDLYRTGIISKEDIEKYPRSSKLSRAIIANSTNKIDIEETFLSLHNGDEILLCTDGLWAYVSEEILKGNGFKTDEEELYSILDTCKRNSKDNYTAIKFRYV